MNVHLEVDPSTAIKIGEYFERDGFWQRADAMWRVIADATAYNRELREQYSEIMFHAREASFQWATPRHVSRRR